MIALNNVSHLAVNDLTCKCWCHCRRGCIQRHCVVGQHWWWKGRSLYHYHHHHRKNLE